MELYLSVYIVRCKLPDQRKSLLYRAIPSGLLRDRRYVQCPTISAILARKARFRSELVFQLTGTDW
jgi:hypothetical protein